MSHQKSGGGDGDPIVFTSPDGRVENVSSVGSRPDTPRPDAPTSISIGPSDFQNYASASSKNRNHLPSYVARARTRSEGYSLISSGGGGSYTSAPKRNDVVPNAPGSSKARSRPSVSQRAATSQYANVSASRRDNPVPKSSTSTSARSNHRISNRKQTSHENASIAGYRRSKSVGRRVSSKRSRDLSSSRHNRTKRSSSRHAKQFNGGKLLSGTNHVASNACHDISNISSNRKVLKGDSNSSVCVGVSNGEDQVDKENDSISDTCGRNMTGGKSNTAARDEVS